MKRTFVKINEDQFMEDIFKQLPSNRILYKKLPGIRATSLELNAELTKRHSIILEPNVPVIVGKEVRNKILGVYENVFKEEIIDYLRNPDVEYKKILTTPESFDKIKKACEEEGINIYKMFYLLVDECDRMVKDVNFRKDIILPMDDFFKFKRKAFISATPLRPSDPRFIQHRFKELEVMPTYDYRKDIEVITTNNIRISLERYFKQTKSDCYFIFLNSTKTIASIIKTLNIAHESHVFCAEESVFVLRGNGLPIANVHFDKKHVKKYNFLSSRFFSAVDIKVDFKPDVLILTDLTQAKHSMIDPYTDTIQIEGRLRNKIKSLTHITNLNENLKSKTKEEVEHAIKCHQFAYSQVLALRKSATSESCREVLDQALKSLPYSEYLNEHNENVNTYRIDNEIYEHKVNSYYHSHENLIKAYQETKHFKITSTEVNFPLDDLKENDLEKELGKGISYKQTFIFVCDALEECKNPSDIYTMCRHELEKKLKRSFPEIVEAYEYLGIEIIRLMDYSPSRIFAQIRDNKEKKEKDHFGFKSLLKKAFDVGEGYTQDQIRNKLKYCINKFGLRLKANRKLLIDYFVLSPRTTLRTLDDGKQVKGYYIQECLIK